MATLRYTQAMKLAIVGTGYVGLVSAACFAELGHEVIGVDIDKAKVAKLKQGVSPIYEPGLEELIQKNLKAGRLSFTTKLEEALPHVQVVFSAVATPPSEGSRADLKAVFAVADTVAAHTDHDLIFVNKSTVPVGTGRLCEERMKKILAHRHVAYAVPVISNPEFLREGMAVTDTLMPDRIVVGINGVHERDARYEHAVKVVEDLYRPITRVGKPLVFMRRESAEIVKYASNAFLATKISFINMMSELAEATGANIRDIARGMGLDDRIGPRFLHAGIGYGGSCFPKDVQALAKSADDVNYDFRILDAVMSVNEKQKTALFPKIKSHFSNDLKGKKIAVWGLAFKPDTDDIREAPALYMINELLKEGAGVSAYDPEAMENVKNVLGNKITFAADHYDALKDADALMICTEWSLFRTPDFDKMKKLMKGKVIFDGRNLYGKDQMKELGYIYFSIGR